MNVALMTLLVEAIVVGGLVGGVAGEVGEAATTTLIVDKIATGSLKTAHQAAALMTTAVVVGGITHMEIGMTDHLVQGGSMGTRQALRLQGRAGRYMVGRRLDMARLLLDHLDHRLYLGTLRHRMVQPLLLLPHMDNRLLRLRYVPHQALFISFLTSSLACW
jgi:hypothetical protein